MATAQQPTHRRAITWTVPWPGIRNRPAAADRQTNASPRLRSVRAISGPAVLTA